jgi:hypothetical protein
MSPPHMSFQISNTGYSLKILVAISTLIMGFQMFDQPLDRWSLKVVAQRAIIRFTSLYFMFLYKMSFEVITCVAFKLADVTSNLMLTNTKSFRIKFFGCL